MGGQFYLWYIRYMIIGITGTLGAGKGTIAEYLTKKHNFVYFSVRNFYAGEVVRRGKLANRDTISAVAHELRSAHGPTYAIEQLLAHARPGQSIVIESIRTQDEVEYLKSKGGILWSIDADLRMRFERSAKRDTALALTFEQFSAKDAEETALRDVMSLADITINCDCTKEECLPKSKKL
jgi:dephospho-CoA kinase